MMAQTKQTTVPDLADNDASQPLEEPGVVVASADDDDVDDDNGDGDEQLRQVSNAHNGVAHDQQQSLLFDEDAGGLLELD